MNETLEAMARAIFKDWFVDFGPTRAKAEGRDPYLAPKIWELFPKALDDEDTPIGWRVGTVGDCFHLTMGQSPPGSTYNDDGEGLPFFQGRTDFGFRYPEKRKYCTAPTRNCRARRYSCECPSACWRHQHGLGKVLCGTWYRRHATQVGITFLHLLLSLGDTARADAIRAHGNGFRCY